MSKLMWSVGVLAVVLLASCATSGSPKAQPAKSAMNLQVIRLDDLLDKKLVGTGKHDGTVFVFKKDNTFVVTKAGADMVGKWSFDPKEKLYPYSIEWTEGTAKQGYIVSFWKQDGKLSMPGYWFMSDAMIRLDYTFTIE